MNGPSPSRIPEPAGDAGGTVTIVVCTTCRRPGDAPEAARPGSRLAGAVAALARERGGGVAVRQVACLGNCSRALSAALYRTGAWTYVFGGLDEGSGSDLLDGAALFEGSTDGLLPWRGRPEALKRGLVARIPPLASLEDPS